MVVSSSAGLFSRVLWLLCFTRAVFEQLNVKMYLFSPIDSLSQYSCESVKLRIDLTLEHNKLPSLYLTLLFLTPVQLTTLLKCVSVFLKPPLSISLCLSPFCRSSQGPVLQWWTPPALDCLWGWWHQMWRLKGSPLRGEPRFPQRNPFPSKTPVKSDQKCREWTALKMKSIHSWLNETSTVLTMDIICININYICINVNIQM